MPEQLKKLEQLWLIQVADGDDPEEEDWSLFSVVDFTKTVREYFDEAQGRHRHVRMLEATVYKLIEPIGGR